MGWWKKDWLWWKKLKYFWNKKKGATCTSLLLNNTLNYAARSSSWGNTFLLKSLNSLIILGYFLLWYKGFIYFPIDRVFFIRHRGVYPRMAQVLRSCKAPGYFQKDPLLSSFFIKEKPVETTGVRHLMSCCKFSLSPLRSHNLKGIGSLASIDGIVVLVRYQNWIYIFGIYFQAFIVAFIWGKVNKVIS